MQYKTSEIAVIGGGMVGGALALGFAQKGLQVFLIERHLPQKLIPGTFPDVHITALNSRSIDFLRGIGVWDTVLAMRAHPYRRVETWEWECWNLIFDARELKSPQLGYMVENTILKEVLWQALTENSSITIRAPALLIDLHRNKQGGYFLTLNDGDVLSVKLVVGADGTDSQVRKMGDIAVHTWQYHQSCMVITVECENNPGDSTWQYFTPSGPRAFLPLFGSWASLVWYDTPKRIKELQSLSMLKLSKEIESNFPTRLGKVIPLATKVFPLIRCHALQYIRAGLALVGDAAHTIHPLVGQGANLGYRDIDVLLDVISSSLGNGEQWASQEVLFRYQWRRMADNYLMQLGIDFLHSVFRNSSTPVRVLRNVGLKFLEHSSFLKHQAIKYALGICDFHY